MKKELRNKSEKETEGKGRKSAGKSIKTLSWRRTNQNLEQEENKKSPNQKAQVQLDEAITLVDIGQLDR